MANNTAKVPSVFEDFTDWSDSFFNISASFFKEYIYATSVAGIFAICSFLFFSISRRCPGLERYIVFRLSFKFITTVYFFQIVLAILFMPTPHISITIIVFSLLCITFLLFALEVTSHFFRFLRVARHAGFKIAACSDPAALVIKNEVYPVAKACHAAFVCRSGVWYLEDNFRLKCESLPSSFKSYDASGVHTLSTYCVGHSTEVEKGSDSLRFYADAKIYKKQP